MDKYIYKELYNSIVKMNKEELLKHPKPSSDSEIALDYINYLINKKLFINNPNCLDFGCGTGYFTNYLKKIVNLNLEGIDICDESICIAKKLYPDIQFNILNITKTDYNTGQFDIVFGFDVIEHIPNVKEHIREMNRILKPGGSYVIATPNKPFNIVAEKYLGRNKNFSKIHPSLFTHRSLVKTMEKNGFKLCFFYTPSKLSEKLQNRYRQYFGKEIASFVNWFYKYPYPKYLYHAIYGVFEKMDR